MKLRFFGRLRDAVGAGEIDCSVPSDITDSDALRAWIGGQYPDLIDYKVRIAVDDVLATCPVSIVGVKEVAFLPPVSGG